MRAAGETADRGDSPGSTPASDVVAIEQPGGRTPDANEAEELFQEIPTAANLVHPPVDELGDAALSPLAQREGAGAYRLVRPTTSDVLDDASPSPEDTPAPKGVVIGVTRKRP